MALSTNHSPVKLSILKNKNRIHGHSFWKFNISLLSDQNYVRKAKKLSKNFYNNQNFILNVQLGW